MSDRPEWWPTYKRHGEGFLEEEPMGVFDICGHVHAATIGHADRYHQPTIEKLVRALEHVRDNWKEPSSMYDRAVRTLVVRTLNERKPKIDTPPDCIRVAVPRAKGH